VGAAGVTAKNMRAAPAKWYALRFRAIMGRPEMVLGHEIPHRRGQKQRIIDLPGAECLAHAARQNLTRPSLASKNRLLLAQGRSQRSLSKTCTSRDSRFVVRGNPLFSNTFSIGELSGKTSAISSWSPAARAIAASWRISAEPIPCPWY
jgi:hypothetical protein